MQQETKIFLSEERGVTQSSWMRSYTTFNFGNYNTMHKTPVDNLYVLNDDTLAAEKSITLKVEEDTLVILLPIAGAVEHKDSKGNNNFIAAKQLLTNICAKNESFVITNPYSEVLVNFLQVWIKVPGISHATGVNEYSFDINAGKNLFQKKELPYGVTFYIGKFTGRQKTVIDLKNKTNTCFAFVIEGAFELEERLLHARDGLALWNRPMIDMEALSNDAIVLVIEMQGLILINTSV